MAGEFRAFVPPPGHQRYRSIHLDLIPYSDEMLKDAFTRKMFEDWDASAEQPFIGVTTDGVPIPGLFVLADEQAPTAAMVSAAQAVMAQASPAQLQALCLPLGDNAWRKWRNPEIYANRHGLRLDAIGDGLRNAVLEIVRASLSPEGYAKLHDCMVVNGFLGDVIGAPQILNAFSYNFSLFGEPSLTEPWGWQLHGHHIAINCAVIGTQMVATPCFWGAEPNEIDEGSMAGLRMFREEELGGLALIRALSPELRAKALLYDAEDLASGRLPPGRREPADHLHLAGAGRDNRVIPYEGVRAAELGSALLRQLLDLVEIYHRHLPAGPRQACMARIERHVDDLWFCWIGGFGVTDPFYYRIQSPVTLIEFDHHAGVFLINETPKKFHIHTLVRTPNGNDYGAALINQHFAA